MKKLMLLIVLLAICSFVFSGCESNVQVDTSLASDQSKTNSDKEEGNKPADAAETVTEPAPSLDEGQTGEKSSTGGESSTGEADQATAVSKIDTGRYQGQADSNFIEIKISGVPDELAAKVFMLSEEVKGSFEDLQLQKDDDVKFEYFENENEQLVIIQINKME